MPSSRFAPAAKAILRLAACAVAGLVAASPAAASVVYLFGGEGAGAGQYILVTPGYVTQDAGFFCAYPCLSLGFEPAPSAGDDVDRLYITDAPADYAVRVRADDYAAGAFGRSGVNFGQFSTLSVADVGDYAQGSVLYLLDSPVGVFTYLSHGLLTGDTGPLTPTSCLYTGDYACGVADFDFDAGGPGSQDVFTVSLLDQTGQGMNAHLRFPTGAFGLPGVYRGSNTRLAVIELPGGVAPPQGVPEPQAWALMIAGLGLVGAAMRARRRRGVVAIALAVAAAGIAAPAAWAGESVYTLQAPFLAAPAGATHFDFSDLGDVRAAFAAAAGPHTLVDFNDIDTAPDQYVFYETGFTHAGVTFTPERGELYVVDPRYYGEDHYGEGNLLTIDYGEPTDLLKLSFAPTHAFAYEFQFLSFPYERLPNYHFGVALSNGLSFSLTSPASFTALSGLAFFGIVSEQAFSSVTLDFPDFGAYAISDNYRIGAAVAGAPEPAAWTLVIAGFGLAGCAIRARRRVWA